MKKLLLVLATVAVSGCAVYPAPHDSGVYRSDNDDRSHTNRPRRGQDQDRDGVPNRADRDRDGDGVPNQWDQRPNDPRYR